MAKTRLAKVVLTIKGVWSPTVKYEKLDLVNYLGSSYIAKRDNIGVTPVEGDDWSLSAEKGGGGPGSTDVPIASNTVAGIIRVGENLKINEDGVLSVDTATEVEEDNTRPVTSAAVQTTVGNIEILLKTI